jgi:hypothetical protein
MAQFRAAVEAATGQTVEMAPTVTAARAHLADGAVDSRAYPSPLLDGELSAIVICAFLGMLALSGALGYYCVRRRRAPVSDRLVVAAVCRS